MNRPIGNKMRPKGEDRSSNQLELVDDDPLAQRAMNRLNAVLETSFTKPFQNGFNITKGDQIANKVNHNIAANASRSQDRKRGTNLGLFRLSFDKAIDIYSQAPTRAKGGAGPKQREGYELGQELSGQQYNSSQALGRQSDLNVSSQNDKTGNSIHINLSNYDPFLSSPQSILLDINKINNIFPKSTNAKSNNPQISQVQAVPLDQKFQVFPVRMSRKQRFLNKNRKVIRSISPPKFHSIERPEIGLNRAFYYAPKHTSFMSIDMDYHHPKNSGSNNTSLNSIDSRDSGKIREKLRKLQIRPFVSSVQDPILSSVGKRRDVMKDTICTDEPPSRPESVNKRSESFSSNHSEDLGQTPMSNKSPYDPTRMRPPLPYPDTKQTKLANVLQRAKTTFVKFKVAHEMVTEKAQATRIGYSKRNAAKDITRVITRLVNRNRKYAFTQILREFIRKLKAK